MQYQSLLYCPHSLFIPFLPRNESLALTIHNIFMYLYNPSINISSTMNFLLEKLLDIPWYIISSFYTWENPGP